MLRAARFALTAAGALSASVFSFAFYTFPDIRSHPDQLLTASARIVRCVRHAGIILADYKFNGATDEVHARSALRTRLGLERNAGLYIKFG